MKLDQRPRVISENDKHRLIKALRAVLKRDRQVAFAYLHGSILGGGPIRDVDVAVWIRGGDPLTYAVVRGLDLERLLGLPVDVQILNTAPTTFKHAVYTKGLPLAINDRKLHDMEVARTILEYADLQILKEKARQSPLTRSQHFT